MFVTWIKFFPFTTCLLTINQTRAQRRTLDPAVEQAQLSVYTRNDCSTSCLLSIPGAQSTTDATNTSSATFFFIHSLLSRHESDREGIFYIISLHKCTTYLVVYLEDLLHVALTEAYGLPTSEFEQTLLHSHNIILSMNSTGHSV